MSFCLWVTPVLLISMNHREAPTLFIPPIPMSHIYDYKDSQALLKHILTLEVMSIVVGAI